MLPADLVFEVQPAPQGHPVCAVCERPGLVTTRPIIRSLSDPERETGRLSRAPELLSWAFRRALPLFLASRPSPWHDLPVNRQAVDLFDDAPWPTELPFDQQKVHSPRPILVASLFFVAVLLLSMTLPWFTSAETPGWLPFSHWLNLGWSPGTQDWGFLVLGLAAFVAIGIGLAIHSPRSPGTTLALAFATALVVTTLLEASAGLSVNPGPNLHADYGAWIGATAAVLAWGGLVVARYLANRSHHA